MEYLATIYLLTGQTGIGKTELALQWAEANDAEILSCDALLFYRGMDIGTAKPTTEEQARVPHHGIDICQVSQAYDITAYLEYAQSVVNDVMSRRKKLLVTGGSGFYLKSFLEPVADNIDVPETVAHQVDELEAEAGLAGLTNALKACNPKGITAPLDWNNPRRLSKALQRCLATGKTYDELFKAFQSLPMPYPRYRKLTCLLQRDLEELKQRCVYRAEQMLAQGLLEEVAKLMEQGILDNPTARSAIGYRESIHFLEHGGTRNALLAEIIQNTYHLIRKQRKWFRNQLSPEFTYEIAPGEPGDYRQLFAD